MFFEVTKLRLLLKFYKILKITEEQLVVIFLLMYLLTETQQFISLDQLKNFSNFDEKKIDKILLELNQKQLLQIIVTNDKWIMDLSLLFEKILSLNNDNPIKIQLNNINSMLIEPLSETQQQFMLQYLDDKDFIHKVAVVKQKGQKITFNKLQELLLKNSSQSLSQYNWLIDNFNDNINKGEF